MFLTYLHASLLVPTIPLYVTDQGGSVVVAGFVLAAFAVTSFFVRPVVGLTADRWSVPGVMFAGAVVLGLASIVSVAPTLWVLALANAVRGVGWAAVNIAAYTMLAWAAPASRRGEAAGYFTVATNSAHTFAPAIALWVIAVPELGFTAAFMLAGGVGLATAAVVWAMGQGRPGTVRVERSASPRRENGRTVAGLFDRGVALSAGLLLCMTLTYTAASSFVPLYGREVGVENTGPFFIAGGVVSIVSRLLLNRTLDRGGRGLWIMVGFSLLITGFLLLLTSTTLEMMVLAGVVHALGSSIAHPILLALAIDQSDPERPASSLATYSMAYQMGTVVGAPVAGFLVEWTGYRGMFVGAISAVAIGVGVAVVNWRVLQASGGASKSWRPAPS